MKVTLIRNFDDMIHRMASDVTETSFSSQSHKSIEPESSQNHLKNFQDESGSSDDLIESSHKNYRVTSSHWLASSSQCRVK